MSRDVDDIIDTATDPVVPIVISASPVASELQLNVSTLMYHDCKETHVIAFVHIKIGVHVALVGTPDSACHAWPGLLDSQNPLYVVAMDFFTRHWVDDRGLNAKERQRCTSGFRRSDSTEWCNDMGASLGLPIGLDCN